MPSVDEARRLHQKEIDLSSAIGWVDMAQASIDDRNTPAVTDVIKVGRFDAVGRA
jgi:hypothetical protein